MLLIDNAPQVKMFVCFIPAHTLPAADPPSHGAASHPPGHPDALPLSNSPRKENQFVDSPGITSLCAFLNKKILSKKICQH